MIRVLHVVGKMHRAGQETITMNIFRAIDRSRITFDFLVHTEEKCDYDDEIAALGGRLNHVNKITPLVWKYIADVERVIREGRYNIVHLHTAHAAGFFVLLAAKRAGASVRIAHSRNDNAELPWLHRLIIPYINHYATVRLACSAQAGRWMFGGKPFTVLPNAIDAARFAFSEEARQTKRKALSIPDAAFVLGHAGRFANQKNHSFLLDVFAEVFKRNRNALLLLAGDGELLPMIQTKAKQMGLEPSIRFLGSRDDMPELFCAMDAFVFPSLYEGFGNVLTEAQAAGLPCIVSNTLSRETAMSPAIRYLPLSMGAAEWAQTILDTPAPNRPAGYELVCKAGFDSQSVARRYERLYLTGTV